MHLMQWLFSLAFWTSIVSGEYKICVYYQEACMCGLLARLASITNGISGYVGNHKQLDNLGHCRAENKKMCFFLCLCPQFKVTVYCRVTSVKEVLMI